MAMFKVILALVLAANAVAFPCRTMGGTTVYPYAYFTSNPRRNRDAKFVIGRAPEESAEAEEDDMLSTPAPATAADAATMAPATTTTTTTTTTTMAPTTSMPRTTAPRRERTTSPPTTTTTTTTMAPRSTPASSRDTRAAMPPNDASGRQICVACAKANFDEVNQYRARLGLSQLRWDDKMAGEAAAHSKDMFERDYFEHSDLPYWENIAFNWGSNKWDDIASGFFTQWKNSAGHDANMRTASHVCGGVGIYGDGNKFYGTQVFTNKC